MLPVLKSVRQRNDSRNLPPFLVPSPREQYRFSYRKGYVMYIHTYVGVRQCVACGAKFGSVSNVGVEVCCTTQVLPLNAYIPSKRQLNLRMVCDLAHISSTPNFPARAPVLNWVTQRIALRHRPPFLPPKPCAQFLFVHIMGYVMYIHTVGH